ncbi:hypothetical protein DPMN_072903 [Dreissena polymorpha]|uniref:Uncharacterized protein n=1 Tax=Dreissena polymorpha TaxID=45954 RepID=A0A9D4BY64_DREPO|nr:hypothetical protein DPMN_072903 [Dreissena polymorpha]
MRWRQCDNTMADNAIEDGDIAMIPRRQYDMTIALSPPYYRNADHCIVALSHLSSSYSAFSQSYERIVAIVLSHCRHRTFAFSHSRTLAI